MKYLIKESQLDKAIFKYLDNQDFIITGDDTSLFFVNSEGDKYAQIRYDEDAGWCGINYDLIKEISSFFSLEISDSEKVIGRWVESTLQMKVINTTHRNRQRFRLVESTLQMKVINTCFAHLFQSWSVESTLQMKVINTSFVGHINGLALKVPYK